MDKEGVIVGVVFFGTVIIVFGITNSIAWAWGIALLVCMVLALAVYIHDNFNADKLFGWMFAGKHYGNTSVRANSKAAAIEFARLMQQAEFDDARAAVLFQHMSEWKQRMWRVKYEERVKQAQRLRELIRRQTAAINADADIADDLLSRERARARSYR